MSSIIIIIYNFNMFGSHCMYCTIRVENTSNKVFVLTI